MCGCKMKKGAGLYSRVKRKRGSGATVVGGGLRKRRRRRKKTKGSGFVAWGGGKKKGALMRVATRAASQFANKFQIARKPRATFLPGATWNPAFQKGSGMSWHSGGGVVIGGGGLRAGRLFHRQGRGRRPI